MSIAKRNISKLPLWVQFKISTLENEKNILYKEIDRVRKTHELLFENDWFVLGTKLTCSEKHTLFILQKDHAQAVCTIGEGDLLLVGRKKKGGG